MSRAVPFLLIAFFIICLAFGFAEDALKASTSPAKLTQVAGQSFLSATQSAETKSTAVAFFQGDVNKEATAKAAEETAQAIRAQQTADTFAVLSQTEAAARYLTAEAESQARAQTAQAIAAMRTQDAAAALRAEATSAYYVQETAYAVQTATVQAQRLIDLTVTADVAKSTQEAQAALDATQDARTQIAKTEAVEQHQATQTVQMQETRDAIDTRFAEAAIQRQETINTLQAYGPYVIWATVIIAAGFIIAALISRTLDRYPDANGLFPLIANLWGSVYNARRNPFPTATVGREVSVPPVSEETQLMVVRGDQMIDLAMQAKPGARSAAQASAIPEPAGMVNFKIFGANEQPPTGVIPPHVEESLEAQWREEGSHANSPR